MQNGRSLHLSMSVKPLCDSRIHLTMNCVFYSSGADLSGSNVFHVANLKKKNNVDDIILLDMPRVVGS